MKEGAERDVFQVLATAEEALHVTEIARRAKCSRPTVYGALAELEREGLVMRSDKVGPMPRYGVNPEHTTVRRLRGEVGGGVREAGEKLLVVEVDESGARVDLHVDPARGVGLEVWVTSLEEARALGKLQKAIERLGLEEVAERLYRE